MSGPTFRAGDAVLDWRRTLHVASGEGDLAVCGEQAVAIDLHWQTVTRMICTKCANSVVPPEGEAE